MSLARVALAVSGAALLSLGPSAPVAAEPPTDPRYPPCADIDGVGGGYTQGTLMVRIFLADTSCRGITYSVLVYDERGDITELTAAEGRGTGKAAEMTFTLPVDDTDSQICVQITTSRGPQVIDIAPDTTCAVVLEDDGNAGGFSFR